VVTHLVTQLAKFVVMGLILLVVAWLARRGHYPLLAVPDPRQAPRRGDRWRYRGSVVLALACGAIAAWGLAAVPPKSWPQQLARHAVYDDRFGPWLGAGFFGLAFAAMVAYPIAGALVAPGPLQHLLVASGEPWRMVWRRTGGRVPDPRPLTHATARVVLVAALFVHFAIREQHVTFTTDGVVWCDWPWQEPTSIPWRNVTAVEVVATFTAMTGAVREVPTLRLQLRDADPLVIGRLAQRPRDHWERLGELCAERAGVPLVAVPR
jgi:hypothetical protein